MAVADTVNVGTGLMGDVDQWVRSDREGVALTHANDRYLEVRAYDYDAPVWRQWTVTVTDRETGASVTLVGDWQNEVTAAALEQIGAPNPSPVRTRTRLSPWRNRRPGGNCEPH